jgi:DNA replication and repair protein RecF
MRLRWVRSMQIERLHIENFRNLHEVKLELPARVNLFLGDNGSGKTSLLEAVHLALTGRSQRRATQEVMLRKGAEYFRLAIEVGFGTTKAKAEYGFVPGRARTLKINNNPVRSLGGLLEEFAVVSFAPEDLQLVFGSPSSRRQAMDFVLSTASASYLAALTHYERAVMQKNKLLKDLQRSGPGLGGPQLLGFNAQIIEKGVHLIKSRRAYTMQTADDLRSIYAKLSDHGETVAITYQPSVTSPDDSRLEEAFEQALVANEEKERILAMSMVGPHRDDWEVFLAGRPAKQYASQGQARSIAVAIKLAGFRYLERIRGDAPVLLFDEIFGELDPGRGRRLLELVGGFAQALITSVQPATAEQLGKDADCFLIDSGAVAKK